MLPHPLRRALPGVPSAALALTAALLGMPGGPAAAQGTGLESYAQTIWRYVDLNGSHQPSDTCSLSAGACSSTMPYASASSTAALGSTSATLSVTSVGRDGAGAAEAAAYWYDTFTITSSTLAPGTPVTLRAGTVLQATVVAASSAPWPYTRAWARIAYGGPSGQSLTSTDTGNGLPTSSFNTFVAAVGSSFTLYGEIDAVGATDMGLAPDFGSVDASASYYLDVLGTEAAYTSASGHDYTAAVPEAPTWACLLGGLALLAWRQRARP